MRSTIHHTKKLLLELNAALNFMHDLTLLYQIKQTFFLKLTGKKRYIKTLSKSNTSTCNNSDMPWSYHPAIKSIKALEYNLHMHLKSQTFFRT